MKVEFWGAAQTVTGSMHLIHWRGKRFLLDCGLYQGRRKDAFQRNRELPIDGSTIDAVVLSHAHIDHSGNLPSLVRNGFRGPIYSTQATRDLATYMLLDSAKIQEYDVEYVNRKRAKKNQTPFEPLYVHDDAVQTLKLFKPIDFYEEFTPVEHVCCKFHEAGHMLGAAVSELVLTEENGNKIRLVFSGDIGRKGMPIIRDPKTVDGANYLIMEATYGNRLHPPTDDAKQVLLKLVKETFANQGKLIIPAFSVGRTQEVVYRLDQLKEEGLLPDIPVFVDSPLAVNVTSVFDDHHDIFDDEAIAQIMKEEDQNPLKFEGLHFIRKVQYSKELNKFKKPAIIISASGMCEAGRILHHLKANIEKPNTTILFVGYQAPHTLGRRILEGQKQVRIFGEEYEMRAKVSRLEASSGHADQKGLLEWAQAISDQGQLKQVALVHCELDSAKVFADKLEEHNIGPVLIPDRGESMELA